MSGSDSSPRRIKLRLRRSASGAHFSRSPGIRRKSVSKAIWASSRASGAPRQKWIPCPNPRCRLSARVMSSRSGSRERRLVAVRRADRAEHQLAARDRHAPDVTSSRA